ERRDDELGEPLLDRLAQPRAVQLGDDVFWGEQPLAHGAADGPGEPRLVLRDRAVQPERALVRAENEDDSHPTRDAARNRSEDDVETEASPEAAGVGHVCAESRGSRAEKRSRLIPPDGPLSTPDPRPSARAPPRPHPPRPARPRSSPRSSAT